MSITIYKYNPENIKIWNDFLFDAQNGIFMFHRNYMDYHKDRFEDHSLMFYDEDNLIALPLNIKENVLYSHGGLTFGGFITNAKLRSVIMLECFNILKDYMKKDNIKHLIYKTLPHIFHEYFPRKICTLYLHVIKANVRAIKLYEHFDFAIDYNLSDSRCFYMFKTLSNC